MSRADISDKTALRSISTFWNKNACAPALGELALEWHICTSTAKTLVDDLQRRGLVARTPRTPRTLRLTMLGVEALEGEVPLVPLTVQTLAELGPTQVIRHMTPRHVECSGVLQAVTGS